MYFTKAIAEALEEEMDRDDNVIILGEDIGVVGGAFGATRGLLNTFGSRRVIQTPVSENSIVGLGIGAAITGMRPVIEIMYMDFIGLAYDQILNRMAKLYYLSCGKVNVPIVIRTTAGGGRNYGHDHSQSLEAIFNHIPGLIVVVPSNPWNAKALLKASIRCDDPVLFVEYRMNYQMRGKVSEDTECLYPLGKAEVATFGKDLTVISYGRIMNLCKKVVQKFFPYERVELIDLLTIKPIDIDTIGNSIKKTKNVLVVDEGYKTNGVAAEIIALINEYFFFSLDAPVTRLTGKDLPIPFSEHLEYKVLPSEKTIKSEIEKCLAR